VSDIAFAHLRALQVMLDEERNIICNLGSGSGTSVLELVNRIKLWKNDFTVQYEVSRNGDPSSLVSANKLSRDILKIEYVNSNLDSILESAISWHERNIKH
jgi:UDP-glucose 4-epimerase